ncbi:MAG: SMP-30/gluconolactonase/LRE family protein [Verrucomicrobia bacterium]|nr:SMP-30/gluconolactonase/LRE family protein [Verrucomicrobiota bacterium]
MKTYVTRYVALAAAWMAIAPVMVSAAEAARPVVGKIERLDPAFDRLVAADAKMEKLAEGFTWSEGPVWYEGGVVFSDVPKNIAYRWKEGMTKAEVFLQPSGLLTPTPGFREEGSNGLALDRQGRLIVCQHGERRVARYAGGKFTVVADRFEGKRFNSPNDVVVRRNGEVYFTDPPYGLDKMNDSPLKEIPFSGVYRVTADGKVTLLTKSLTFPNGIAFSPDEKILYIAVSDGKATRVVAYDVKADGTIEGERTFFDAQPLKVAGGKGSCDGLKVDREGNVWTTGPGGVLVLSPAGKLLGKLDTGVPTANCGWGDDGSTLYITANQMLLRVRTKTKGAGW